MAVCPNSFVATDIDSSKEKDKTKIHMDIKQLSTIRLTCSKMDKNYTRHRELSTQNDPQNTKNILTSWRQHTIFFCVCQSNGKNIFAKFHEKILSHSQKKQKNTKSENSPQQKIAPLYDFWYKDYQSIYQEYTVCANFHKNSFEEIEKNSPKYTKNTPNWFPAEGDMQKTQ